MAGVAFPHAHDKTRTGEKTLKSPRRRGEQQLLNYLDHFHLQKGYMLSFNFNKKKEVGVKRVQVGGKVLFEGTV